MLAKIVEAPWMFVLFVGAFVLLHFGAWLRLRHDERLKKRPHAERRGSPRLLADNRWSSRKRKKN